MTDLPYPAADVSQEPLALIKAIFDAVGENDDPTTRRVRRLFNEIARRERQVMRLQTVNYGHSPLSE